MSIPYGESSQVLDSFGVTYEELLFYEQHNILGKRVRLLLPIASIGNSEHVWKLLLGTVTALLYGEIPLLSL